jgi:hypothetical protein
VASVNVLSPVWETLSATSPAPPVWVVLGAAALALYGVVDTKTWRTTRHLVTLVHEGGHAVIAVATGRQLDGVKLRADTSGLTLSRGNPQGLGMIATAAAGYPGPTALGLVVTVGVVSGHLAATLWGCVFLVAAFLVVIRNLFGVLSVLVTGAILISVPIWAPSAVQAAFGYLLAWFLLLSGTRPVLELHRERHAVTDADILARLTGVPRTGWVGVFLLIAVGGAAAGGWALLGPTVWERLPG